ncbi:hypothetical protein [Pleurocapsa sp. FMAR1]|uniref:hypothetical protein n=1 Tax=Pleurocapsa sp. FMAR1 TaxID=3040204 RepID=UPI0029C60184|nr:hypothetical protein [Pleurocapsa sp. FMAR1]
MFEWLTATINSVDDTIVDLIMDAVGAIAASLLSLYASKKKNAVESSNNSS